MSDSSPLKDRLEFLRVIYTPQEARQALYEVLTQVPSAPQGYGLVHDAMERLPAAEQQLAYELTLVTIGTDIYPVDALRPGAR